jgi:hypothetical protein
VWEEEEECMKKGRLTGAPPTRMISRPGYIFHLPVKTIKNVASLSRIGRAQTSENIRSRSDIDVDTAKMGLSVLLRSDAITGSFQPPRFFFESLKENVMVKFCQELQKQCSDCS